MVERVRVNKDDRVVHDPVRTNHIGGPLFAANNSANRRGRRKGSPNRMGTLLKDAIIKAAEELGEMEYVRTGRNGTSRWNWRKGKGGLLGYLKWMGVHEPKAFAVLLGRVIPLHVVGDVDHTHHVLRDKADIQEELRERGIPIRTIFPKALPPPSIDNRPPRDN
jgi:hypothetical protein